MIEQLQAARWFGGKSRTIRDTRILDRAQWVDNAWVCLVDVHYAVGPPETYVLTERFDEPVVARALLARFSGASLRTEAGGSLEFRPTHLFASMRPERAEPVVLIRGEQSNTSVRFGDELILKLFRRLQFGPNPDVEIGRFLTEHSDFRGTPAVMGSLAYIDPGGHDASLALLQCFERNRGDAWTTTLQRVRTVLEGDDPSDSVRSMARLGQTTADLHVALSRGAGDFSPEPVSDMDIAAWREAITSEVRLAADALAARGLSVDTAGLVCRAEGIAALQGALKTRHHGDYHLGQVLEREDGSFAIIDFEGEPVKPLWLRRERRSPLRDVAGMLRSFDYARNAALRLGDASASARVRAAARWYASAREAFLEAYLERVGRAEGALLPRDVDAPLAALELEKAAYEVLYELNNRPDWLPIPVAALAA
ncbi:MAG TPA: hypothetical protein VFA49_12185 [Chloroflexota bacterium]|nr:hypothetical protein [Chloroflexota bacterium]